MKGRGAKKKGKLLEHFSSDGHKVALRSIARFSEARHHIESLISKSARKVKIQKAADNLENRQVVKILFDIVRTLGRQNIAFRGDGKEETSGNFQQIVMLVARHCPILGEWLQCRRLRPYQITYMSPESQNEMIRLIANDVNKRIVEDIKKSGLFAVSADTTPDLSNKDQMAIVCRYVNDEGEPKERLLKMDVTNSKTGEATAEKIIAVLNAKELDTKELKFQSYDFTSSMSCQLKGAQKMLQDKLEQIVPYIPCQGHRSSTVVEHSCAASSIIKVMFGTLEEMYVLL